MKAVVQRISQASVTVDQTIVASVEGPGLLVLLGVTHTDTRQTSEALAAKVWGLRILTGESSAADLAAPVLVVSQFTLYADTRKGRRPSWSAAAPAAVSQPLYEHFCSSLGVLGAPVQRGVFGALMQVASVNEGPMTVLLEV